MLNHLIMQKLSKTSNLHIPNHSLIYIFPIHGLRINQEDSIDIGYIRFVFKDYLISELKIDPGLINSKAFSNTNTFCVINLENYGNLDNLCIDGNNSIAIQLVKQAIGVLRILNYVKCHKDVQQEGRIIVSNNTAHELDELLYPYIFKNEFTGSFDQTTRHIPLGVTFNSNDIKRISLFSSLFCIELKRRTEFQNKLFKAFEILYNIQNEIYANERILKCVMLLNHIFKESPDHKLDSPVIGNWVQNLFIIGGRKHTLNGNKIIDIIPDLFTRLRNNPMHGLLDPFKEIQLISQEDYVPLLSIVMELILILVEDDRISSLQTTKDLNKFIVSEIKKLKNT